MRRLILLTALLTALPATVAIEPVYSDDGLAIRGFDPVAYFEQARPVRGSERFSHEWMGTTWRFATRDHRDAFAADPEAYAPQYGGYCAWAVSRGDTASIDPQAWRIVDGKLYLNYSPRIQRRWERDVPGNIDRADVNWPRLRER